MVCPLCYLVLTRFFVTASRSRTRPSATPCALRVGSTSDSSTARRPAGTTATMRSSGRHAKDDDQDGGPSEAICGATCETLSCATNADVTWACIAEFRVLPSHRPYRYAERPIRGGTPPWRLCDDQLMLKSAVRLWVAALTSTLALTACASGPSVAVADPTLSTYQLVHDLCAKLDPTHLTELGSGEPAVRNWPDRPDSPSKKCSLSAVTRGARASMYTVQVTTGLLESADQGPDEPWAWPGPDARGVWRDVPELEGSARVWLTPIDDLTDPPPPFTGPTQARTTELRAYHDNVFIWLRIMFTAEHVPDDSTTEAVAVAYAHQTLALMRS